MIHFIDKWAICPRGHYVFDRNSCAHCDGYTEFPKVSGRYLGNKVALYDALGNLHPMEKADVVNGWRPDHKPPAGWMLYYMTFTEEGNRYWKIGITQKPYTRLYRELAPTILDLKYIGSKEDAYREEQRLLRLYDQVKINIPRLRKCGRTEMFDRDVLNGGFSSV